MSSSQPSTRKTRAYRGQTLQPAGYIRRQDNLPFLPEATDLEKYLLEDVQVSNDHLRSFPNSTQLPRSIVGDLNNLEDSVARIILPAARLAWEVSFEGVAEAWTESEWRSRCHTPSFLSITRLDHFSDDILMRTEASWATLNLREGVSILSNRPDYSFALRVRTHLQQDDGLLSPALLETLVDDLDPFMETLHEAVFPFAVVESKSADGSELQAENQCADSIIKMLYKLRKLGAETSRLPVIAITWIASRPTIYIAVYRILFGDTMQWNLQSLWCGRVTSLSESIQFHIILYRLLLWARGIYRPAIMAALQRRRRQSLQDVTTRPEFMETSNLGK